jgi:Leucine-rich repeat (LRR) protein
MFSARAMSRPSVVRCHRSFDRWRAAGPAACILIGSLVGAPGCDRRQSANAKTDSAVTEPGGSSPEATPAASAVADDPQVVASIEASPEVQVERSGGHIVKLDLSELLDATTNSRGGTAREFAWCAGLPKLKTLVATGPGVTDDAVAKLAGHPSLAVLNFSKRSMVGDKGIAVIKDLPQLADVSLERSAITDQSFALLAENPKLKYIRVPRTNISDVGVAHLAKASQLQLLDLLECPGVTGKSLAVIGQLKNLRNLRLFGAEIRDEHMPQISGLEQLEALGLQYCRVGDEGLKSIAGMKKLKELNLYGTKVTDAGLPSLAGLSNLQKLRLRETGLRGEQNLDAFATLTNLRELDVSESPVQDSIIDGLIKLPKLESLNLWNTQFTDAGAKRLSELKSLRELNLDNLWNISDVALEAAGQLPELRFLHVGGTSITDEGLVHLKGLQNLETIHLTKTVLSPEAVDGLKAALPNLKRVEY